MDKVRRNRQNAPSRARYNAKTYDSITFRVKLDGSDYLTREMIQAAADRNGMSFNSWIIDTLRGAI